MTGSQRTMLTGLEALTSRDSLPICTACGTQFEVPSGQQLTNCAICDDPRQYIPPDGQTFTNLAEVRKKHRNVFRQDEVDGRIWNVYTEPKFAIGQRCILLETPDGNILWDCITLLDEETVNKIKSIGTGNLLAIVISHPHFYTTWPLWSQVFITTTYTSPEDTSWLSAQPVHPSHHTLLTSIHTSIARGITIIKAGGHFPGSLALHFERTLLHSDTLMSVPSSRNPESHRFAGRTHSYAFMWSIPNMIPLGPAAIWQILDRLRGLEYDATFGNIPGLDVRGRDLQLRVLESAKIQIRAMGWEGKEEGEKILREVW